MFNKILSSLISGLSVPKTTLVNLVSKTKAPTITLPAPVTRTGPKVYLINESTVLTDLQIREAIAALQIQLDRDFAPVWNTNATLSFWNMNTKPPADAWQLYIKDTSDQAGALGYHDLTDDGMPIGYVFAKDDLVNNLSWTVTISHELLEMLVDPWIANTVFVQSSNTVGILFALEVCDAVEDDSYGYLINGVRVSDFVYPAWFEGFRKPNSTRFCYSNKVTAPFQLLPGGYISTFSVNPTTTGWSQITAQGKPGRRLMAKPPTSRKNRRGAVEE